MKTIKFGPIVINIIDIEKEATPEEILANSQWCETCEERHRRPDWRESYEEWCISVGHKPLAGVDGIDNTRYRINKKGFVVKKKR